MPAKACECVIRQSPCVHQKEQAFEMPTGGTAFMRIGENLAYFSRKEQCLALGAQLRTFKLNAYKIYRIFPNGEVFYGKF